MSWPRPGRSPIVRAVLREVTAEALQRMLWRAIDCSYDRETRHLCSRLQARFPDLPLRPPLGALYDIEQLAANGKRFLSTAWRTT